MIRAVLFDLDDVVRYFEPCDIIEKQFALPPDSLTAIAFRPELEALGIDGEFDAIFNALVEDLRLFEVVA